MLSSSKHIYSPHLQHAVPMCLFFVFKFLSSYHSLRPLFVLSGIPESMLMAFLPETYYMHPAPFRTIAELSGSLPWLLRVHQSMQWVSQLPNGPWYIFILYIYTYIHTYIHICICSPGSCACTRACSGSHSCQTVRDIYLYVYYLYIYVYVYIYIYIYIYLFIYLYMLPWLLRVHQSMQWVSQLLYIYYIYI